MCSSSSAWNSRSCGSLRTVSRIRCQSLPSRRRIIVLALHPQQAIDHSGDPLPVFRLSRQLLQAALCNGIEFRLAVVFRSAPLRRDPSFLLQPQKRRVNSSFVSEEHLFAQLLQPGRARCRIHEVVQSPEAFSKSSGQECPEASSVFLSTSAFPLVIANKIAGLLWNVQR